MRRAILICGVLGVCYVGWEAFSQRSATIDLKPGHALTYTVAWGLGMDQRLTLKHGWEPWSAVSSKWIEIWKRPYNSGAVVYGSEDGNSYFIGTSYNMVVLALAERTMYASCDKQMVPKRTTLADQLLFQGPDRYEQIDPGASQLTGFIPQETSGGAVPATPPLSKYYLGLRYLGRFGIVDPGRKHGPSRGNEVSFVPAESSPEPRLGLQFHCG
jgi:hypothetical protein